MASDAYSAAPHIPLTYPLGKGVAWCFPKLPGNLSYDCLNSSEAKTKTFNSALIGAIVDRFCESFFVKVMGSISQLGGETCLSDKSPD